MATVSAKVYEHQKKKDGTFNVKIIVYHQQDRKHIDTTHFVSQKQLTPDFQIKDKFLNNIIDDTLESYRTTISQLGAKLDFFTCEALRDHLRDKDKEIDFIDFCASHIAQLRKENRDGTANNHRVIRNSLIDYFKRESVSINEITSGMLYQYEKFLRGNRTLKRTNHLGKTITTTENGLSDSGLHNHMRDLRTLFNAACKLYNDEDLGVHKIKHYPFKKYKIGSAPLTRKRNITIAEVETIKNCKIKAGSRAELARDIFMLSFYLCGMNAVDIYNLNSKNIYKGRIEYNRSKTKVRRKDKAFISIKIIKEVEGLLSQYLEQLPNRFSNYNGLNAALSKGMMELRKLTDIDGITLYWARHTFANTARNVCRMSKDDVALALNHIDEGHRTTDIYISKDWKIVDEVQERVVSELSRKR
jgi:integrase